MLTIDQIQGLLAPNKIGKKPVTNALIRTAEGTLEQAQVKPSQYGKHEGRMGTKRRSAKGRVSIMPNGIRYYNDVTDVEVVAYRA